MIKSKKSKSISTSFPLLSNDFGRSQNMFPEDMKKKLSQTIGTNGKIFSLFVSQPLRKKINCY